MGVSIAIVLILAIAATIATFILLLPERRKNSLSPFWYRIREFLTMRVLYLEKILRTLYVITTVFIFVLCVGAGLLTPFIFPGFEGFGNVLLGMILGLLVGVILSAVLLFIIRISYESTMLKVSLTKAAKDINERIGGGESRSYDEPRRRPAPQPRPAVCRRCGAHFDPRRGYCPNCDERW